MIDKPRYKLTFAEALSEAERTGFIEDKNDPWVSLECFGTLNEFRYNCDACPLYYHCDNERIKKLRG